MLPFPIHPEYVLITVLVCAFFTIFSFIRSSKKNKSYKSKYFWKGVVVSYLFLAFLGIILIFILAEKGDTISKELILVIFHPILIIKFIVDSNFLLGVPWVLGVALVYLLIHISGGMTYYYFSHHINKKGFGILISINTLFLFISFAFILFFSAMGLGLQ